MATNYEWLLHMDGEERQAWFDAEHVDNLGQIADMSQKSADCVRNDGKMSETGVSANDVDANDENATCNNSGDFVTDDSREKIEDDVCNWIHERRNHYAGNIGAIHQIYEWLNRQAEITHAETIHTYNLAAREARKVQENRIAELQAKVDELRDELAKRDKGIARLKRQRDTARAKIDELHAECDTCCYKTDYIEMDFYDVDRLEAERDALEAENMALKADSDECVQRAIKKRDEVIKIIKAERDKLKRKEKQLSNELGLRDKAIEMLLDVKQELIAERDNLAADLQDCDRQRERLRQALGCAIDHAHETVSLVNLDGEVIR